MAAEIRFYGPAFLTTTPSTLFTVSDRAVIQIIHIMNESVSSADITLSIGTDSVSTRLYDGYPIPSKQMRAIPTYHVMDPGESMQGSSSANSAIVLVVSGIGELAETGWGVIEFGNGQWGS